MTGSAEVTSGSGSSSGADETTSSRDETSTGGDDSTGSTGTASFCGDGIVDDGEACDDAGESAECNADCTVSACGDGVPNASAGEACDGGGESVECNVDCTEAVCGDSLVNATAGEVCDDGATEDGDGCSSNCQSDETCGNLYLDTFLGETCDDGNDDPEDGCDACQAQPMQVCAGGLPVDILDDATVESTLEIPFPYVATDVDVVVELSHGQLSDLAIGVDRDGKNVALADMLSTEAGLGTPCTGQDMTVAFDDDADAAVQTACDVSQTPAIDGRYRPVAELSGLAGEDIGGSWTLSVTDGAAENAGTLDTWCVNLNGFGVAEPRLYWAVTADSVWSVSPDGSDPLQVVNDATSGFVVAVNRETGHVYYDRTSTTITRVDADGSNPVDVVTNANAPFGLAVDPEAGFLFRSDFNADQVVRTDLDGGNALTVGNALSPSGMAVDPVAQRVYFITYNNTQLYRVNYDGTGQEVIVPNLGGQGVGVAVDPAAGLVYYSTRANDLFVAELDGSNPAVFLTGQTVVQGLTIDPEADRIYWAAPFASMIRSAALSDGGDVTDVTSCNGNCWGLGR